MSDHSHQYPTTLSPVSDHDSPPEDGAKASGTAWKKRVSTACLACKKSKRKCSGTPPCDNCRTFHRTCVFDESLDQRRRVAAKRTADELTYHRDLLNDLFRLVREAHESKALTLLDLIRRHVSPDEIRAYIGHTLADLGAIDKMTPETVGKLEDIGNMIDVQREAPAFRRNVMDIYYLCDGSPARSPSHL
ncbi:hypothetical protein N7492_004077 [Penicillium capsulatum]|uniref:Zn(2)-C6 fungal-type domain-containing protein n=1 Tax=Penicillium capsulatum TaxID=69766 RepID=A0A9W9IN68_9EURO|nr:hypothetical protein N7492_004077 [Penicillium capsulatum]